MLIQLNTTARPPDIVVDAIASINGPVDIYCWYEGKYGLPKSGAEFMKESIFEPLYARKKDTKVFLYSLKAWNPNAKVSCSLDRAINRINTTAIECLSSASFFQWFAEISGELSLFINKEIRKKKWLIALSEGTNQSDYSIMQYVEGYFLIRESIIKRLAQQVIEIAFVLPNDEYKYYSDFQEDIPKMLRMEFGEALDGKEINITLDFFQFGESLSARPYFMNKSKKVKPSQVGLYFNYLKGE